MFDIQQFLDLTGYEASRKDRRKKDLKTQEFFTPYSIVKRMCEKVDDETWADPAKTFLEPSFGSGQFCLYIIWSRLQHGVSWRDALKTLYGVELMSDNVAECKQRICEMLEQLCEDFDKRSAMRIMNKRLICHDFFTWDFENWRPYTEEEMKKLKVKKK